MLDLESLTTHRRGFLGRLAAGAAAVGLGGLFAPLAAAAQPRARGDISSNPDFEKWLDSMMGKHRQVVDATNTRENFSLTMTFVWLMTQRETYGLEDADLSAVLVMRHSAIAMALSDDVWAKYKLGEH